MAGAGYSSMAIFVAPVGSDKFAVVLIRKLLTASTAARIATKECMNSSNCSAGYTGQALSAAFLARDPAGSLGIAAAFLEPVTKPSPDLERPLVRLGRLSAT